MTTPVCTFGKDDTFALRVQAPLGITPIDPAGQVGDFAATPGIDSLSGITFDTGGRFGHRLLVSGNKGSLSGILAIDCQGHVTVIAASAPRIEGGIEIAPDTFSPYAGDLVGLVVAPRTSRIVPPPRTPTPAPTACCASRPRTSPPRAFGTAISCS